MSMRGRCAVYGKDGCRWSMLLRPARAGVPMMAPRSAERSVYWARSYQVAPECRDHEERHVSWSTSYLRNALSYLRRRYLYGEQALGAYVGEDHAGVCEGGGSGEGGGGDEGTDNRIELSP